MAPDLFGRPDQVLDQPGLSEAKVEAEHITAVWDAWPYKVSTKSGKTAIRDALIQICSTMRIDVGEATKWLVERVETYAKYAKPHVKSARESAQRCIIPLPQTWFGNGDNGQRYMEDEQDWRLSLGVPVNVEAAERVAAEERREKLADAESRRRFYIEYEHQKAVLAELDEPRKAQIVGEYRTAMRSAGETISSFVRSDIDRNGLKAPHVWLWAVGTGRVPAPDYSIRKDSS